LGVVAFAAIMLGQPRDRRMNELHKVIGGFPKRVECCAGVFLNPRLIQASGVVSVRSVVSISTEKHHAQANIKNVV